MKTIVLIIVLGVSIAVGAEIAPNVIGNNEKAKPDDAPWIVSLQLAENDFAYCGATLINATTDEQSCLGWVLTAASCLRGISQDSIIASLRNWNLANSQERIPLNITHFIEHENFNATSHENDIALLKTTFQPVPETQTCETDNFLNVAPPSGFNETFYDETQAWFLGWGLLVENGPLQKELYNVSIPLLTDKNCTGSYTHEIFKGASMMCAGVEGFGLCSYDTGGPLVCNYEESQDVTHKWLCGIASFGHGCGSKLKPAIFTDIASNNFTKWIEDKMVSY
ncbi:Serine protease 28 [Orchesella cincta]|uniref:Serine protease 28 n=1 Tax=Orchesella cincta TaxID=48709 RepID=A0A1D2NLC6_ORCCI|nr:Serine protease 28 [Orchesella cincta]